MEDFSYSKNKNKVIGYFCRSLECTRTKATLPLSSALGRWASPFKRQVWKDYKGQNGSETGLTCMRSPHKQSGTFCRQNSQLKKQIYVVKHRKGKRRQYDRATAHLHKRRGKEKHLNCSQRA